MYHRIRRVRGKDARVCGVLAGISKYLDPDWDPLIIRLIFLLIWFFSGMVFMTLLYFALAVTLHVERPEDPEPLDGEEPLEGELFKEKE